MKSKTSTRHSCVTFRNEVVKELKSHSELTIISSEPDPDPTVSSLQAARLAEVRSCPGSLCQVTKHIMAALFRAQFRRFERAINCD